MSRIRAIPNCLSVLIAVVLLSHTVHAENGGQPVTVGQRYSLDSKILQEKRTYLVHTPARYDFTKLSYPVVVVLDGDAHFEHTSATVDFLARNGRIPEMIVVAINNTNRGRDMTPPLAAPANGEGTPDGTKNFLAFIGDELLPEIDRRYRTRPYRVLIGHSYGGLFATYALISRPETFNAYLMISPSLWWDKQGLVRQTEEFLATHKDLRADLFVTLGGETGNMLGGYWRFSAVLGEARLPNLRWKMNRWPDETHGSVPLRSTHEGLQSLFDGWFVNDPLLLYDQIGLAGIEKQYASVSTRMGYTVPVPEALLSVLQTSLDRADRKDETAVVAQKRVELYPESPAAQLALARIYAAKNDDAHEIEHLSRALALFPGNRAARSALERHKVDVTTLVPQATPSARQLAAYVGEYRKSTETARVTLEDGKLYSATDAGKCELRATSATQFYCTDADVEFTFNKNKSGRVTGVTVQQPDGAYERVRLN